MKKTDLTKSIQNVLAVFLILILGLITYIAYFQFFKAPKIAEMPNNNRLWAERNEVLRGTIYDRDGTALTKSSRNNALTQDREYVYGDIYAHILGYVDPKYSITGLENTYDHELRNYKSTTLKSFFKSLNLKEAFKSRNEVDNKIGNSIVTTLDTKIQKAAYDALGNNKGAIVAIDPKTGEILASVSKPTFNPNNLDVEMKRANDSEDYIMLNRAVSGMYAPGSTFKIVTLSSTLENISGARNKTFEDNGKLNISEGYSLGNYGGNSYGTLSLKEALGVSSNVAFGSLALELGNDKLKATAEKYGFNTGIEGDGVVIDTSKFPTLDKYQKGDIAQTGIGQGAVLATPMQMALVASTVANNGVMMQPRLVNEVKNKDGETVKTEQSKELKRVISEEDAKTIQDYMKYVVDRNLVNKWSSFQGLNAAGKTGTADYKLANGQDAVPHSWFIGFAPANDPQIAIAVIVENGGVGAGKAAEAAGKVLRAALK